MTRAAAVYRQSQGRESSVSLTQQRDEVGGLARELADAVDEIDLGNHTGFSIHTRDADEQRLDDHPEMTRLVSDLEAGRYDVLCAWDDTRLARDQYIHEIERAAKLGDCELAFVADVERDDLAHGVQRVVEREVKKQEIEKSKQATEQWAAESEWQGQPPKGLQYGPDKRRLVPDQDFETVLGVLDRLDDGETYREIRNETGISLHGIGKINERGRAFYERFADRSSRG